MPIWLIIAAIAGYAIYRSAHHAAAAGTAGNLSAGTGKSNNYKLNKDDGGLTAGTVVSYAGNSTDLLNAVAGGSTVNVTGPAGQSAQVSAASLDPVG